MIPESSGNAQPTPRVVVTVDGERHTFTSEVAAEAWLRARRKRAVRHPNLNRSAMTNRNLEDR